MSLDDVSIDSQLKFDDLDDIFLNDSILVCCFEINHTIHNQTCISYKVLYGEQYCRSFGVVLNSIGEAWTVFEKGVKSMA